MTDAVLEVQDQSLTKARLNLELLTQGGITLYWDEIEDAIRASTKNLSELRMSRIARDLRIGKVYVFAIWINRKVHGLIVCQPSGESSTESSLVITALAGKGIGLDDWQEASSGLESRARNAGFKKIVALTDNERMLTIAKLNDWTTSTCCYKEL